MLYNKTSTGIAKTGKSELKTATSALLSTKQFTRLVQLWFGEDFRLF
jgi:hypothetical protein